MRNNRVASLLFIGEIAEYNAGNSKWKSAAETQ